MPPALERLHAREGIFQRRGSTLAERDRTDTRTRPLVACRFERAGAFQSIRLPHIFRYLVAWPH